MNFCKDCKWLVEPVGQFTNWELVRCSHPVFEDGFDPVSGAPLKRVGGFCDLLRKDAVYCGAEGRYFEAKEREEDVPQ